ncbi:MAG TPA: DUF3796 domain-containing protein [Anaerovoracaceae bacterium]|nr:DUF3796 domain-containing protein [Anaerovoracaceae bacterium]
MKLNKLGLLSLLALIGILGLTSENKALLGFFGFACYFRYFFVTPDEMFLQNVRKAASLGFFSGVAATGIATVLFTLFPSVFLGILVLAACFVISVIFFSIALVVLEYREQRVG